MLSAQQGDNQAYAKLFKTIIPILKNVISQSLNNPSDREDLLQDILLSIHRASHTYDADRSFKNWMYAIAHYRLNDYLRKIYKNSALFEAGPDELIHDVLLADVTDGRDRREYIIEMLESLPEKQKKILTLMKIEGYSVAETALAVKMSVSAVKVAAHRAYKSLSLKNKRKQG